MNRQTIIAFTWLLVSYLSSMAQTVSYQALSSGGGYYANATHSNSWTVGQLVTTTFVNTNHKLTQGFQQPAERDLRISGRIQTEIDTPIAGVTVTLSGSAGKTVVTGSDGLYKFNVLKGGSYVVTPSKSNDVSTNNGVTTGDISLIRKHVLTGNFFTSPYKIIASDANNSGTVSTGDIVFVRKVVLNNTVTFPITTTPSITYGRLWEFVSSGFIFTNPQIPFPFDEARTYSNISSSQSNQNFIGIKLGDVNNNWDEEIP